MQSTAIEHAIEQQELITALDTLKNRKLMEYSIDRDELLHLRSEKIIPTQFYVYLALKLSFPEQSNPSIDIEYFCGEWGLSETELASAITQLQKKRALRSMSRQLELELF